jgi:hypothetical protein
VAFCQKNFILQAVATSEIENKREVVIILRLFLSVNRHRIPWRS